jgi:dTMP kinase
VVLTREPGGTAGAEALRELLLSGRVAWSAPAEAFLHFAARADHVEAVVRPALARGAWVVCDRFSDSTMAYQAYGQGADPALIAGLSALLGLAPDLTLVLDVPQALAADRLRARGLAADRYEREDGSFQARVRAGFLAIAAAEPARCAVIAAGEAAESVAEAIWRGVRARLNPPAVS